MNVEGNPVVGVVDDENSVLESMQDLLEGRGYSALVFLSAKAFLDSGALSSINCLISDLRMPDMSGWELERYVNQERPDLPVILLTGHDPSVQKAETVKLEGRARMLFKKPCNGAELLDAIAATIAQPPPP